MNKIEKGKFVFTGIKNKAEVNNEVISTERAIKTVAINGVFQD